MYNEKQLFSFKGDVYQGQKLIDKGWEQTIWSTNASKAMYDLIFRWKIYHCHNGKPYEGYLTLKGRLIKVDPFLKELESLI